MIMSVMNFWIKQINEALYIKTLSLSLFHMIAELDSEHAQKVLEMEHAQQAKLKERQKYFEEAFQQDMEQYLSTGYLQITDRRGETFPCTLCLMSNLYL